MIQSNNKSPPSFLICSANQNLNNIKKNKIISTKITIMKTNDINNKCSEAVEENPTTSSIKKFQIDVEFTKEGNYVKIEITSITLRYANEPKYVSKRKKRQISLFMPMEECIKHGSIFDALQETGFMGYMIFLHFGKPLMANYNMGDIDDEITVEFLKKRDNPHEQNFSVIKN